MTPTAEQLPVLASYGYTVGCTLTPLEGGLINQTLLVEEGGRRTVLQRLNPIFHPNVHLDIEPITAHLERKGLTTPRLIPTTTGHLWITDERGQTFRMLSFVAGRTVTRIARPETARAAGKLAGRFHSAVSDLSHTFHFERPGAHDTAAHLQRLRDALETCTAHLDYASIAPLAERILAHADALESLPSLPKRLIHGDLKISNLLFDETETEALALLDLDTMAYLSIPVDLGDALRSWCNPAGEDAGSAQLRFDLFEAAIAGVAEAARTLLTEEEIGAITLGAQTIALELSSRFCADALREQYFSWNPEKFPTRSAHNRVRAESQLAVAESAGQQRAALERAVRASFAA